MNDDAALLRRYAEEGSEAAFAELVHRHVDLVYGAALRRTGGDAHRAHDVAQQVFITLARDARKLSRHAVLAAWLHTATRNAALNLMISEQRRQTREAEAVALEAAANTGADPEWDRLRPLLDTAIDELPEADRAAVVLRFLEKRPFAEVGSLLQVSEDAARMRTDRALDKLRAALSRRGVTSTSAALGLIMTGQALAEAPAGLAATLTAQSLAAGVGIFATLMTTKIITTAVLTALVAFGAGTYVGLNHETATPPPVVSDQSQLIASLRKDNQQLTADLSGLNADVVRLNEANAALTDQQVAAAQVVKKSPNIGGQRYDLQQAVLNNLRQIDAARKQYQLTNGHPAASIEELVGIGRYIKTVRTVGGEDYWALSMLPGQPLTVVTPDGVSVTYDPAGTMTTKIEIPPAVVRVRELGAKVQPSAMKAVEAYRTAHNGDSPPNEAAILSYFATPQEGADYVEFMEVRKAANQ
ncbi:MAG: RNA polymerase sigma factor [Opitutaceae bacterium]|nr:RNA polymerase sigma factor [Opitutaceae bacterium]